MQQFNTLVFAFDEESNHLDTFLSVQHSKELINWLAESRKHLTTIYVAATRGLRPNEIFALGVNDLQGKRLMIDEGIVNNVVGEPKTDESKAPVPLTIDLRETLESYIHVHGLRGDDFLFASSTGSPM